MARNTTLCANRGSLQKYWNQEGHLAAWELDQKWVRATSDLSCPWSPSPSNAGTRSSVQPHGGWPPAKGPCAVSGPEHKRAELQAQGRVSAATQSLSFSCPSPWAVQEAECPRRPRKRWHLKKQARLPQAPPAPRSASSCLPSWVLRGRGSAGH